MTPKISNKFTAIYFGRNGIFHHWGLLMKLSHFQFSSWDHLITERAKGELCNKDDWNLKTENPLSQLKCRIKIPRIGTWLFNSKQTLFYFENKKGQGKLVFICMKTSLASQLFAFNWLKIFFTTMRKVYYDLKILFFLSGFFLKFALCSKKDKVYWRS